GGGRGPGAPGSCQWGVLASRVDRGKGKKTRSVDRRAAQVKRPLHALACLGAASHHAFELAAGVGLVFQPYLGLAGAFALWGISLPAWLAAAVAGSARWD